MVKGLIYSVLSAICFGMLPILGKLGYMHDMTSNQMLQYRFLLGSILLGLWFLITRRDALRITRKGLLKTFFLGAVIYPVQSTCYIVSVQTIPASTAVLIFYFYPALVTVLAALVYKERIGRKVALSLVLVTGGCMFVFMDAFMREVNTTGVLWACGGMVTFSVYLMLVQSMMRGEKPLTFSLYVIFFAGLAFTAIKGLPDVMALDTAQAAIAVSFALIPTVLAVTLLYVAIEAVGSAYASIFSTLEPVATVAAAWALLGEPLALWQLFGAVLIVAGILVPNLDLIRRKSAVTGG